MFLKIKIKIVGLEDNSLNQVYTETLNSGNLKAENASQNDIMGFVNDEKMLHRIEKIKCQNVCFSVI